jgi:hypothetical protein
LLESSIQSSFDNYKTRVLRKNIYAYFRLPTFAFRLLFTLSPPEFDTFVFLVLGPPAQENEYVYRHEVPRPLHKLEYHLQTSRLVQAFPYQSRLRFAPVGYFGQNRNIPAMRQGLAAMVEQDTRHKAMLNHYAYRTNFRRTGYSHSVRKESISDIRQTRCSESCVVGINQLAR